MKTKTITCPVSADRVNEYAARIAAAYTIILVTISLLFYSYPALLLLAADFGIRAFTNGRFSLLRLLAKQTVQTFRLGNRPVNAAPKRFAAGVGFVFLLGISLAVYLDLSFAVYLLSAVLLGCALLEAVFAYCVGCVVYSWLMYLVDRVR